MSREVNLGQIVPNIQIGQTTTGSPTSPASVTNVGTTLNPILNFTIPKGEAGAIKMLIVQDLPATGDADTIYLVPNYTIETGNIYNEFIYINGSWEELGSIPVEVDLTDYYKKEETYSQAEVNALIPSLTDYVKNTDYATQSKGGVIKIDQNYGLRVSSGTLIGYGVNYTDYQNALNQLVIDKGTLENVITGKDLTTKAYVDGLVGDINTALDTINGEVI